MNNTRRPPLLSGPPPDSDSSEPSCRRCGKEFVPIFFRPKRCNHCGYSYCKTCAGFTALMPRDGGGHDQVPVCCFCIPNLNITAGSKVDLLGLTILKLKNYADAYDLHHDQIIEKDDLVEKLMRYREVGGWLPRENEDFYRKHSVPSPSPLRSLFSRQTPPVQSPRPRSRPQSHFPRPDVEPQGQPPPSPRTPRPTSMPQTRPPPRYNARPQSSPRPPQSNLDVPQPNLSTRPRATSHGAATQPPPPTLDQLLTMEPEQIRSLPISALKKILFNNHVSVGGLIEKPELAERVMTLIADERRERERQESFRQMEEEQERLRRMGTEAGTHIEPPDDLHMDSEHQTSGVTPEQTALGQGLELVGFNDAGQQTTAVSTNDATSPEQQTTENTTTPPQQIPGIDKRPAVAVGPERDGLCVVCQDGEANIAIVDCGHMAMCRECSDQIMGSTRECPLCRTRIVTEARLLRIFKT